MCSAGRITPALPEPVRARIFCWSQSRFFHAAPAPGSERCLGVISTGFTSTVFTPTGFTYTGITSTGDTSTGNTPTYLVGVLPVFTYWRATFILGVLPVFYYLQAWAWAWGVESGGTAGRIVESSVLHVDRLSRVLLPLLLRGSAPHWSPVQVFDCFLKLVLCGQTLDVTI